MGDFNLLWREFNQKVARLPIKQQLLFVTIFCLLFFPVYALGLWRGAGVDQPMVLALAWERAWPFVPWMIVPYLSLFAAYAVPVLFLPAGKYPALTRQALAVVMVSGLTFLALPTASGFTAAPEVPLQWQPLFALVHAIDAPYNLVPSLHVAGAAVVLLASADNANRSLAIALRLWLAVISISTLFVHQHHLIDVFAGLALAACVRRLLPLPAAEL